VPLRSVEAATRDDAIAAAREQFGPQARIVGVRRVRSGGVLGFFATERYVAEVAPDVSRPPAPTGARASSPLASATPATAAPTTARPRTSAPARNGAAAYAAESGRTATPRSDDAPRASRSEVIARAVAARSVADDDRVSELAGLLGSVAAEADDDLPTARPGYQRATFAKASWTPAPDDEVPAPAPAAAPAPATGSSPSPFTAALARMVAGDRDVQQAVEEALDQPTPVRRPTPEPRPIRPAPAQSPDTTVWPRAARQEEETVGDQVVAPPSMPAASSVELPTWAAAPEAPAVPDATRQEEVAEVLRSALAQGHSDEALAGILRKVLDGVSPQAALPEPALPEPVLPEPVLPELVMADNVVAEPSVAPEPAPVVPEVRDVTPLFDAARVLEPVFEPVVEPVVPPAVRPLFETRYEVAPAPRPMFEPLPVPRPPVDIWGTASSAPLWGEPVLPRPVVKDDAPIWAEVVLAETPVAEEMVAEEPPVEETVEPLAELVTETFEDAVVEPAVEVVADDETPVEVVAEAETPAEEFVEIESTVEEITEVEPTVVEATADETITDDETTVAEDDLESETLVDEAQDVADESEAAESEIAPLLARTASDPAPVALPMSMSLDATTVMPPLSLLPPLPSSRGRGRPPGPPALSRASAPAPRPAAEEPEPAAEPAPSLPMFQALATVTRLPVAPLMAGSAFPEISEEEIERLAPETEAPEFAFAVPVTEPDPEPTPAPAADLPQGDVVDRLAALGLPARFLGAGFSADVETLGTYAALTRALGLHLPAAPEIPRGADDVLFVIGPGVETLRAARSLAASMHLDPDRVQWASRGDLAALAPAVCRMTTIDAAKARHQEATSAGTVTIVAVDTPMRADEFWMTQLLAIWSPVAVWAVVEATRKPEDVGPWLDDLARVDALIVTDTDASVDPAAVLHRVAAPVVLLDGIRATPHRWASLLCERLEGAQG
jgi:hypothetical protein